MKVEKTKRRVVYKKNVLFIVVVEVRSYRSGVNREQIGSNSKHPSHS